MAAPAFGSAGTELGGASATASNIPVPASVAVDDIILAFLYKENTNAVTMPSGFTQVTNSPVVVTGTQAHNMHIFWKRATGADSGTYNFTIQTAAAWRNGVALRFTGCIKTGVPFDVLNSAIKTTTADGSIPAVSVTTTGTDRLLVWSGSGFGGGQYTAATGMTERYDGGDLNGNMAVDTLVKAAAGASGSITSTIATNTSAGAWLGALLPIPPASSVPAVDNQLSIAIARSLNY